MLAENELMLLHSVFSRHPEINSVVLFGSRAMGKAHAASDVDLIVHGCLSSLDMEKIAMELDELPLPYKYDVQDGNKLRHGPLREHIERVGITIYTK